MDDVTFSYLTLIIYFSLVENIMQVLLAGSCGLSTGTSLVTNWIFR